MMGNNSVLNEEFCYIHILGIIPFSEKQTFNYQGRSSKMLKTTLVQQGRKSRQIYLSAIK